MSINGISQSTQSRLDETKLRKLEELEESNDTSIISYDNTSDNDIILDEASQDELLSSYDEALAQAQTFDEFNVEIENIEEIDEASIVARDRKPYSDFRKKEDTTTDSTERNPHSDFRKKVTEEQLNKLGIDERLQGAILDGRLNFDPDKYGVKTDTDGHISSYPKFNITALTGMGPDNQIFSEEEVEAMKESNANMSKQVDDLIEEQSIYHSNPLLNKLEKSDLDPTLYKAVLEGRFKFDPERDHWQPYYDTDKNGLVSSYIYINDIPGSDPVLNEEEKAAIDKHNKSGSKLEEMQKTVDKLDEAGVDKRLYNAILDGRLPFNPDEDNYSAQRFEDDSITTGIMWDVDALKQTGDFSQEELQALEEHNTKNEETMDKINQELELERDRKALEQMQSDLSETIAQYDEEISKLKQAKKDDTDKIKSANKEISKLEKRKEKLEKNLKKKNISEKRKEKLQAAKERVEDNIQEKKELKRELKANKELLSEQIEQAKSAKKGSAQELKETAKQIDDLQKQIDEIDTSDK